MGEMPTENRLPSLYVRIVEVLRRPVANGGEIRADNPSLSVDLVARHTSFVLRDLLGVVDQVGSFRLSVVAMTEVTIDL